MPTHGASVVQSQNEVKVKGTILFVISQIVIKQIILMLSNANEAKKQFEVK